MYKKMFLIAVILAVAAGISFAEGNKEKANEQSEWQRGQGSFSPEIMELTGTVMIDDEGFPVLKSGNEEYVLMYPNFLDDEIDVQDGDEVTVEGFIAPHPRRGTANDVTYLRVTKATIDGEEYEIPYGPRDGGRRSGGKGFGPGRGGCCDDDDRFQGRMSGRRSGRKGW